jgi:hypothetical protein
VQTLGERVMDRLALEIGSVACQLIGESNLSYCGSFDGMTIIGFLTMTLGAAGLLMLYLQTLDRPI